MRSYVDRHIAREDHPSQETSVTYRAEEDLVLSTALDRLADVASGNRGRLEDFAAIAAAQRHIFEIVQERVDRAERPWWRRWF